MEFSIQSYEAFVRKDCIPIQDIVYEEGIIGTFPLGYRPLEPAKVRTLCDRFASEGCRKNDYPIIVCTFDQKYVCLDGKHRLEAGKIFLEPGDQSWSVLIFQSNVRHRRFVKQLLISQPPHMSRS